MATEVHDDRVQVRVPIIERAVRLHALVAQPDQDDARVRVGDAAPWVPVVRLRTNGTLRRRCDSQRA